MGNLHESPVHRRALFEHLWVRHVAQGHLGRWHFGTFPYCQNTSHVFFYYNIMVHYTFSMDIRMSTSKYKIN